MVGSQLYDRHSFSSALSSKGIMVDSLEKLIEEFSKLPGIGKKTAQRMAFHVLKSRKEEAEALAQALLDVKEKVNFCSVCFNITEEDLK